MTKGQQDSETAVKHLQSKVTALKALSDATGKVPKKNKNKGARKKKGADMRTWKIGPA